MNQGEIVEQGSHEELLEKKGEYYRLWEMQQGNFVVKEEIKRQTKVEMPEFDTYIFHNWLQTGVKKLPNKKGFRRRIS